MASSSVAFDDSVGNAVGDTDGEALGLCDGLADGLAVGDMLVCPAGQVT